MIRTLRSLIVPALLLLASAATAGGPLVPVWVPEEVVPARAAAGDGDFFAVLATAVDTAAILTHPVIEIREGRPTLHAITQLTGERGVLRPHAHSSARAETDSLYGVAFFVEREKFTSLGGANVYGLEGGAAIRVLEQVDFTARYRMLSYDGTDVLAELEPEVGAPLFGFALHF